MEQLARIFLFPLLFVFWSSPFGASLGLQDTSRTETDPEILAMVRGYLGSPEPDVRTSALAWMARDPRARDASLIPLVFAALKDKENKVRNEALSNMGWIFAERRGSPEGRDALAALADALQPAADRSASQVAVEVLRGSADEGLYADKEEAKQERPLLAEPSIQALVASLLSDPQSSLRPELLEVVKGSRPLQSVPAIVDAVGKTLQDNSLTVRSEAADLLIAIYQGGIAAIEAQTHPILLTALAENDPNVQLRISKALGLPIPPRKAAPAVRSLSGEKISTSDVPYDFNYFTAFVQPLFGKRYANAACVDCHTPQANASGSFRVLAPGPDGRYTLEQSRTNFVSLMAVIDRKNPDQSKLLRKPLNPRAPEGDLKGMIHDGGVFWGDRFDPDFQVIEAWLKGGKLETPPEKQLDFAYFVQHVEPIFSTPGSDGIACINCHTTHAILHLESPESREGKFSVEQLENNYQSAHRVIDENAPSNSFIVRKPTSPREGEAGGLSHAGGIRWPDKKNSWQYRALITWSGMHNLAVENKPGLAAAHTPSAP
jgi:HEAT repeat protein